VELGITELEPKGYCWDERKKAWRITVYWGGKNVYFGMLKAEDMAKEAGKALVHVRSSLPKGSDFKSLGKPIFMEFKSREATHGSSSAHTA